MKHFEVRYFDPSIPGAEFVVVNKWKCKRSADQHMRSMGYKPNRIRELGRSK